MKDRLKVCRIRFARLYETANIALNIELLSFKFEYVKEYTCISQYIDFFYI